MRIWFYFYEEPTDVKLMQKEKYMTIESWVPGAGGVGNGEFVLNGHKVSVPHDEKVLRVDDGDGCTTLWTTVLNATDHTLKDG